MGKRLLLGFALCAWLLSSATRSAAEPIRELTFHMRDLVATGSLLGLNLVAEFAWPAPSRPRWTEVSQFDLRLDAALGVDRPTRVERSSDALLGVAMVGGTALAFFGPASATGADFRRYGLEDLIIVLEAAFSAGLVAQSVKKLSARRRPAVHFDATEETDYGRLLRLRDRQRFTSFYSGHASITASIAAALVSVSYLRGYAHRHAVAIFFGVLSLSAGALRVAARWHWASDVIAGWALGAALGGGVPLLREYLGKMRRARASEAWLPRVRAGPQPTLQLSWMF
jgi:membrane-associated phospholipid phosphatase